MFLRIKFSGIFHFMKKHLKTILHSIKKSRKDAFLSTHILIRLRFSNDIENRGV